ncbi:hypothetical protein [Rhizobium sp. 007]|uniref:hypothetical protein n=1 Tax=Rhizobium sp. 007 TaxID=2785056 RepID=UPI00188EC737|nr:hypothetical protein [Rhizobium sp. 007]QPB23837.1 hypothetical protein ISN39_30755 [Rhizobium sp. 007]
MNKLPVIQMRRKGKTQTQRMLIPSETMIADELWAAPPGCISDLAAIRRVLAAKYGADACCPVTVRRHLVQMSRSDTAPFWRVIDPDRPFARRVVGGPERIRKKLTDEGDATGGRCAL